MWLHLKRLLARERTFIYEGAAPADQAAFSSLASLEALPGTTVTSDRYSGVSRIELTHNYYVKFFRGRSNWLRHLLRRDRYSLEVRNLTYFSSLGLATPAIAATGHRKVFGLLLAGVLVTREVENSHNFLQHLHDGKLYADGPTGARQLLAQLASALAKLHTRQFYAADIKPRNILVAPKNGKQQLIFFDCPRGHVQPAFLFRHNKVKDLAHLYRDMRDHVRRVDLLRAYKLYLGCEKLSDQQKQTVLKVITYYDSRKMTEARLRRQKRRDSKLSAL
jgi:tRNA A-37 threonylcarbamoyl transferase component Bud32